MSNLDHVDRKLLELLQSEFPIVPRPFDAIGDTLGIGAAEVLERTSKLKRGGIIRQISAIFDSAALGYRSELVAVQVEPAALDSVAEIISHHKGVSHCYSRDADYNLWFTVTVAPEEDLAVAIETLSRDTGAAHFLRLPQTRQFKIGVFLDVTGGGALPNAPKPAPANSLDPVLRPFVRVLQRDLPLTSTPFKDLASASGLTEPALLTAAKQLLDTGIMRRFAAVLRHVKAGFKVNAMVCWQVPESDLETAGLALARHPSVSHCYQRAISPDWPWPLYTMVHCRTQPELDHVISELKSSLSAAVSTPDKLDYRVLRTLKEYKKSRVTYFD